MIRSLWAILTLMCAAPAGALDLLPPNATVTNSQIEPAGSVRVPTSSWDGAPTKLTEGRIERQAVRIAQPNLTTLQLIQPIREKLQSKGYKQAFTCADASCGGFDFRFQLDLLPAPDMFVDLGDYRYLVMEKTDGVPHTVSIVASRSTTDGFLHITQLYAPNFTNTAPTTPVNQSSDALDSLGIIETLTQTGHTVLADLKFETGSSDLGIGSYESLLALSLWLGANPNARIVLVGHTDSVGSLEANTNLSRKRALSVANRLTDEYSANGSQIQAAGAGYLSPIASNLTETGRATNRRVEVVLLSLD